MASSRLETGFLPALDEGTIVLDYFSPPGTSLEETDRLCQEMETIILDDSNVETYSRRTGMRMAFRTVPPNYGDYLIQLKTDRSKTTDEIISELRKKIVASVPVMNVSFGQRIADLLGDLMSTSEPIEIKLFGDDYNILQQKAEEAENILRQIPGLQTLIMALLRPRPHWFLFQIRKN